MMARRLGEVSRCRSLAHAAACLVIGCAGREPAADNGGGLGSVGGRTPLAGASGRAALSDSGAPAGGAASSGGSGSPSTGALGGGGTADSGGAAVAAGSAALGGGSDAGGCHSRPVGTISGPLATGVTLVDTDGERVNAHGGGIIQVDDVFYMHGMSFSPTHNDNAFIGFTMYSLVLDGLKLSLPTYEAAWKIDVGAGTWSR